MTLSWCNKAKANQNVSSRRSISRGPMLELSRQALRSGPEGEDSKVKGNNSLCTRDAS